MIILRKNNRRYTYFITLNSKVIFPEKHYELSCHDIEDENYHRAKCGGNDPYKNKFSLCHAREADHSSQSFKLDGLVDL